MAKAVSKTGYLSFNSVDLTTYVESLDSRNAAAALEVAAWNDTAMLKKPGLPDQSVTVRFRQDFAASTVDATLYAALVAGTEAALAWRFDSGAISTSNPEYQVTAFVSDYNPAAEINNVMMATATFDFASAVTRDTTP